jgi:uncharacterized protein YbaR (Trm112 family)
MSPRLLSFLTDPNDGAPLELHTFEGSSDQVREGVLVNAQSGRWYPIREGIPTLFVDALRTGDEAVNDAAFARRFAKPMQEAGCDVSNTGAKQAEADFARIDSERRARDEQAEDYDRMLRSQVLRAHRDADLSPWAERVLESRLAASGSRLRHGTLHRAFQRTGQRSRGRRYVARFDSAQSRASMRAKRRLPFITFTPT